MTSHLVKIISSEPWCVSVDADLFDCEGKMGPEVVERAVERGKCRRGHAIDTQNV